MKRIRQKITQNDFFDTDDLRLYIKMPAREKLNWLEDANTFLQKATRKTTKKIWEKLKTQGF